MGLTVEAGEKGPSEQREIAKKGPRVAIISGIIDIGVQEQEFQGEKQRDCREFIPILTLVNDKYTDENGDKHCMVTSPWPVKIKLGEKANYVKFCKAADPNGEVVPEGVGDIAELIGRAVFATMTHTEPTKDGIVYANCKGIQELPEDYPIPEVDITKIVFDCSNPDKEVFDKLWDSTKDKIRKGVNWDEASAFSGESNSSVPSSAEAAGEDLDDDIPF